MTNELILLIQVLLSFTFIQVVFRWNKYFLLVAIVLNLLLVSVFGAKLVSFFGLVTNSGNVFYAMVFFATQILAEQYGKKEALKSIWVGACAIVFFMLMAQLTIMTIGSPQTEQINYAIDVLFQAAPRVALASIVAYTVSQFVNISLFSYISQKTAGKLLFLRVNLSNVVGQFVDSLIFFTIAFWGTGPMEQFVQVFALGYVLKVVIGALSTPFFYLSGSGKADKSEAQ